MLQIRPTDQQIINTLQGVVDNFLIPKFMSLGMNASGSWINSLQVAVEDGKGVIKGKDYTYFLAYGRGPNEDQTPEGIKHFAGWFSHYVLKPWAQDKGIVLGNAYMAARKIAIEGTKDRPGKEEVLTILQSKEVTDYIFEKLRIDVKNNVTLLIRKKIKNGLQ